MKIEIKKIDENPKLTEVKQKIEYAFDFYQILYSISYIEGFTYWMQSPNKDFYLGFVEKFSDIKKFHLQNLIDPYVFIDKNWKIKTCGFDFSEEISIVSMQGLEYTALNLKRFIQFLAEEGISKK